MRGAVRLSVVVVLCLLAVRARAHDPWEATGFDQDPSGRTLALTTNRGILLSRDAGQSWRYLCRNALSRQLPLLGVTSSAQVLVASRSGLDTLGGDGCGMRGVSTPMTGNAIADLQRDPSNAQGWYATTTKYGEANGLFYSGDDGATWSALGALEAGPFFKSVRPSHDGKRIYVVTAQYFEPVGAEPDHTDYSVRWSDDRGQSWTRYPVSLRKDDRELVLLGVDPANPDRLFGAIHVCRQDESCLDRTIGLRKDSLLVSSDRGQTWTTLMELSELAGFELDASTLWVGDWQGGLWRMKLDGTGAEALSTTLKAGCVHKAADALFVCGTDLNGFMLARSTDGGATLEAVARSGNTLGNPECPVDPFAVATLEEVCELEWNDLCRESFFDDPKPPAECSVALAPVDGGPFPGLPGVPDAADLPPPDAGVAATAQKKEQGCSLSADGQGWLGLSLTLLGLRRRRRL